MSELNILPDEEPNVDDPDYDGNNTYRFLDNGSSLGVSIEDRRFDKDNPEEAKRIKEETERSEEDPKGQNLATRRGGGK